jgi:ribosomal-protein-alanine N-acetyltransferase
MSHKTSPVRVRLEKPSIQRAPAFVAAVSRSRRLHAHWAYPPSTHSEYKVFVDRANDKARISYLICTASGELAGVVNVSEIVRGPFCSGYLGYYAFAPNDGCGYMFAGMTKVIGLAFGKHRLHRLEANIQPGNARSIALVHALGFRREGYSPKYLKIGGRWRDHERWALTADVWRSHGAG